MFRTRAVYNDGVPPTHCRVRICNEEGEEYPGQEVKFSYGHPTDRTNGVVTRRPVFGYDPEHTYRELEKVFSGVGGGADADRLSEEVQKLWCDTLDQVDMQPVDFENCEGYIKSLMTLCDCITYECTGKNFVTWGFDRSSLTKMTRAWEFFVRSIWVRDPEWENMVRYLSDPNRERSVDQEYYIEKAAPAVRREVTNKLLVPLEVWRQLLATPPDARKASLAVAQKES